MMGPEDFDLFGDIPLPPESKKEPTGRRGHWHFIAMISHGDPIKVGDSLYVGISGETKIGKLNRSGTPTPHELIILPDIRLEALSDRNHLTFDSLDAAAAYGLDAAGRRSSKTDGRRSSVNGWRNVYFGDINGRKNIGDVADRADRFQFFGVTEEAWRADHSTTQLIQELLDQGRIPLHFRPAANAEIQRNAAKEKKASTAKDGAQDQIGETNDH